MAVSERIGAPKKRQEDIRLLRGKGMFLDDRKVSGMLHAALLRSPYPHARILAIDATRARRRLGVKDVVTGEDIARMTKPSQTRFPLAMKYYSMAVGKVRYVGEPVAAVVAETREQAIDALEDIEVEYKPLPAVSTIRQAMSDSPALLHEEAKSNIGWHDKFSYGDVDASFSSADLTISRTFTYSRYSSTPLEPYGCIADYNSADETLTLWDMNQEPGLLHAGLSYLLGIPTNKLRTIESDIGGGYGNKTVLYPYIVLVSTLSKRLGSPVKWVSTRSEDLAASTHSPDRVSELQFALSKSGRILGAKMKIIDNYGAYLRPPEPGNTTRPFATILGCYKIPAVEIDAYGVMTNRCPTGPNRGYGCQHSYFALERMVDTSARELGIDPAEIRFRNFINKEEFPFTTPLGCLYDSGDYEGTLRKALNLIDYQKLRDEQRALASKGRLLGIGMSTIVEPGSTNFACQKLYAPSFPQSGSAEAARVTMTSNGKIIITLGSCPQGQGHETVATQIVSEMLGIPPQDVTVVAGFDTYSHPWTSQSGTYGCRFSVVTVGALKGALDSLIQKILNVASRQLNASPTNLIFGNGEVRDANNPEKRMTLPEIAQMAYGSFANLPDKSEPGLNASYVYSFPRANDLDEQRRANFSCTYGNSTHIAIVDIDPEVGKVNLRRYLVVSDCGTMLNPLIVEGQVQGGIAHGLGGALYEEHVYNEEGQLLNPSFIDYLVPTALEVPNLQVEHQETPSPFTVFGSKGVGEGGAMGAPVAIANAVEDALTSIGVEINHIPYSPENVWQQMNSRRRRTIAQ